MPKAVKMAGLVIGVGVAILAIIVMGVLAGQSLSDVDISIHGWIAMALGIGFTILVGRWFNGSGILQ